MEKQHLLIKGSLDDARAALTAHGVGPAELTVSQQLDPNADYASVSVIVAIEENVLIAWFCEPPTQPPYPPGTLLYYGSPADSAEINAAAAAPEEVEPWRA